MKNVTFFLALILISCNSSDSSEEGFIKFEIAIPSSSTFNKIRNQIVVNNSLITLDRNSGIILCSDKITGDSIWEWSEASDTYGGNVDGFGSKSYIFDNVLVCGQSNLTYGIDVSNGSTIWHHNTDRSAVAYISGNETRFTFKEVDGDEKLSVKLGDIYTGETSTIFEFEKEDDFNISGNLPFMFEYNGQEYVTFTKTKWGYDENVVYHSYQWLHLYNLTEDKLEWVSDTIPLEYNISGTAGLRPVFHDGQILLANDAIYSYNIEDGSLEWSKYFGNSFVLGTHLSDDYGRVYGNNASGFMVSIDVHTGEEYFNVTTGSSASRIVLNDGKAYINSLTGIADNHMQIRDAYSGELLRSIDAPYHTNTNNRYFDEVITVDPETGYIYTADHVDILCFDPQL